MFFTVFHQSKSNDDFMWFRDKIKCKQWDSPIRFFYIKRNSSKSKQIQSKQTSDRFDCEKVTALLRVYE